MSKTEFKRFEVEAPEDGMEIIWFVQGMSVPTRAVYQRDSLFAWQGYWIELETETKSTSTMER